MSAFTQLLDRGLPAEAAGALAAWNPTMDLLALALEGQLAVHRLNWQRLWWASPDAPVTALEWRPDGKQLAVGLEDGSVLLLNTEDGEVQQRRQLLPDALVAISWTEAAAAAGPGETAQQQQQFDGGGTASSACGAGPAAVGAAAAAHLAGDRTRRMFAPPPPPVPAAAAGLAVGYDTCGKRGAGGQAWPAEPPRLAVLACASAVGEVALCTSGLFPLATLHLPALLGCPAVSVLRLAAAPSLQQLAVCWRGGGSPTEGPLRLSSLSMRHVGAHAAQLHRLALAAAQVEALLEGCRQSFRELCKEWGAGQKELGESRRKLAALMSDYGSSADPAAELQGLVATGAVGGALQQYITATLGEPGLKKLARAVDVAACSCHNLLTDHLQPQLEQLAFRLGELRGLALCLPWRRVTGLQPEQVAAAEQAALRLVLRAEAVRQQVVEAGAQYRTFFAWLLIVMRRMQEDAADALAGYPRSQLDAVSAFLAGQYRRDCIGPLLGSCSEDDGSRGSEGGGDSPGSPAAAAGSSGGMLDLIMEVLGRQTLVQAADSTATPGGGPAAGSGGSSRGGGSSSLGHLLSALQAACTAAFHRTSQVISPTLQLAGSLALGPSPCALAASYQPAGEAGGAAACAAVAWEGRQQVLVVRSRGGDGDAQQANVQPAVEAALLQLPAGCAPVDLAWYKDGQLALLLAGEGQPCRLALLPQDDMQFTELPAELLGDADALQLCQLLLESTGSGASPLPEGCRQRELPYPWVQAPLAVSASRGVGCVLAGTQRVLLYDLEEDEDEEEDEEGGEELADAVEGHDMDSDTFESPLSR
ncbi:hypothetical protein ABPG75_002112 [Micractinium tetrahymenae]